MLEERLRDILAMKGMSKEELAEVCDLPLETIRNIYYGKTPDPKTSTMLKISKALNLSINCLMGECVHTSEERTLLNLYRQCGKHGKSIILFRAKYEALTAKEERNAKNKHAIPCLLPQGDIRNEIVYDDCNVVDIYTNREEAYLAIKMTNNDLVPSYCKGDILLIENRFPLNNELGVFFKNGRAFIRQYIEDDEWYRLRCLNDHLKDMKFKRMDDIEYVGTCCGVMRS